MLGRPSLLNERENKDVVAEEASQQNILHGPIVLVLGNADLYMFACRVYFSDLFF